MSLEIRAKIICDQCGAMVEGDVERTSTYAARSYWRAKAKAKEQRWFTFLRYGTATHYCANCADGVCNSLRKLNPQPPKGR